MKNTLYNEFDPFAARWIDNLQAAGIISPGEIDDRDFRGIIKNE